MDSVGIKDAKLDRIPADKINLIARAFLKMYWGANFFPTKRKIVGKRKKTMVRKTIKEVTHALGKMLWDQIEFILFHKKGNQGNKMTPNIIDLLSKMENISPNSNIQKTMIPDLLRCMDDYMVNVILKMM